MNSYNNFKKIFWEGIKEAQRNEKQIRKKWWKKVDWKWVVATILAIFGILVVIL